MFYPSQQLPIFAAKEDEKGDYYDWRFLGNSFHVDTAGTIASCEHVLSSVVDEEILVGCTFDQFSEVVVLTDVRTHPTADFGLASASTRTQYEAVSLEGSPHLYMSDRVRAYGSRFDGKSGSDSIALTARVIEGYVANAPGAPSSNPGYRTHNEVSFGIPKGYSGSPLLGNYPLHPMAGESWRVVGMCAGTVEESFQLYQYSVRSEDGKESYELIRRVTEIELVHSAYDIRTFMADLGFMNPLLADAPYPIAPLVSSGTNGS